VPKKLSSKRPPKTDQILIPFQHRCLSVLAAFWEPEMVPKSIKNRSKLNFRTFLFPHLFLHWFLIDFCPQLRATGSPKIVFFLGKKHCFFQKTPLEDNIDFGFDFDANLPPCWLTKSKIFRNYGLPRGLQIFIFFGIDGLPILAPSWPDGSKFEKMAPQNFPAPPQERCLIRSCLWRPFKSLLASIFGGSGVHFLWFLDDFSNYFAKKKIQELAEDKAENPRSCRGESRKQNPYERLQENSSVQAVIF